MKKTWMTRKLEDDLSARLHGTNGSDRFEGYKGIDVYNGRGGHDLIIGFAGGDRLSGGGGHDTIYGGPGEDSIFGGSGNDTLWGGMHDALLKGGSGADVFLFSAWRDDKESKGSGTDVIADFDAREDGERIEIATAQFDGIATFAALKAIMVQDGDDVVMSFDSARATLVLKDMKIEQLHADDFHIYFG